MKLRALLLAATALVAVTASSPARAEPISAIIAAVAAAGSIGGAIAGVGTFAALAINTVVSVGVSLGLSALGAALAPKPKAGQALSGMETSVQIGGDVARQICIGTTKVAGQLIYHNTFGSDNQYYERVFALSDWRSDSLTAVFIDGKRKTLNQTGTGAGWIDYTVNLADETRPGFFGSLGSNLITIRLYLGTQTAADAALVANSNPSGRWTNNSVVTGVTYAKVLFTYKKDAEVYEGGVPEIHFELRGAKLYDWRKDSTAGGSGVHRWNDPATWEYSDNPIVAAYNFQRGFYLNGQKIIGMGVPAGDLLLATYTAAANVCDELVATSGAGQEKRYRCATILTADDTVSYGDSLEVLLSTCAGYLYDYAGYYYAAAGAAQVSERTFTDKDLVIGHPVTYSGKRSRADLANRIHGQYLDTANGYVSASYTAQVDATAAANDGEELGKPLDLLSVPSKTQAERIARIRLREARAQASARVTLGFEHIDLMVGDWITWQSARYGGTWPGGQKTFRITQRQRDAATATVTLELVEVNAAIFTWSTADEGPAASPVVGLEPGQRMTTVGNFNVTSVELTSTNGEAAIPALVFTYNPVEDETVDSVLIEYRIQGGTEVFRTIDPTPADGNHRVTAGILPGTTYEARASVQTDPPRLTTWTGWDTSTTPNTFRFRLPQIDESLLEAPVLRQLEWDPSAELLGIVEAEIATSLDLVRRSAGAAMTRTEEVFLSATENMARVRTEMYSAMETANGLMQADIQTALTSRTTPEEAESIAEERITARITTPGTDLNTALADINTALGTKVTLTQAEAAANTRISAQLTTPGQPLYASFSDVYTAVAAKATPLEATTIANNRISAKLTTQGEDLFERFAGVDTAIQARATPTQATTIANERITARLSTPGQDLYERFAGIDTTLAAKVTETEATTIATTQASAAVTAFKDGEYTTYKASVTSQFTAVTNITGDVVGTYSLITQANGYLSGMRLITSASGSSATSAAVWHVDNFQIGHPSHTTKTAFSVATNQNGTATLTLKGDMITSGSISAAALNVATLSAITADMGTVTAGLLKSPDNQFQVDLVQKRIIIYG